jgi:Kazal-type serine protease inhibitor-like protein
MYRSLRLLGLCTLSCLTVFILATTLASAAAHNVVCICHIPPGNPSGAKTICIDEHAVPAHLRHGDTQGECSKSCGGSTGVTCSTGQFCKLTAGVCSADAEGVCAIMPTSCGTTVDPVCGCDGNTYDNACLAAAAGASVSHTGECVTGAACGGSTGGACLDGEFCKRDSGGCATDAAGVCTPVPATCPTTVSPVCGCDGLSYSNACFADAAGVTVSASGACVLGAACGGSTGGTCSSGQFCEPLQGDCSIILGGNCTTPPLSTSCSASFDPVCGCDDVTYDNACLAAAAGVGVSDTGPCVGDLTCGARGPTCSSGDFCKRPDGTCGDVAGTCTPTPTTCPAVVDPVCGCNGTTYSSACVADAAGVTVSSEGPCVPTLTCGGGSPLVCPTGQFCEAAVGTCSSGAVGTCTERPTSCSTVVGLVCGCNGTTYTNACLAEVAGVTVNHTGSCP